MPESKFRDPSEESKWFRRTSVEALALTCLPITRQNWTYPANNLFLKQKRLGRGYMPESKRSEQVAGAKPPTHACQSSVKAAGLDGGLDNPASKH